MKYGISFDPGGFCKGASEDERPNTEKTERWKEVSGYEGLYRVSDWGRIQSIRTGGFLRGEETQSGHRRVTLYKDGSAERKQLHRIVAQEFLGDAPSGKTWVLHWDDNPQNNRVENLRWGDAQDNVDDAIRNGVHPGSAHMCPKGHPYIPENLVGVDPKKGKNRRCRECENQASRESHNRGLRTGIGPDDPRHGSYAGYRAGCRCEECKLANRTYKREWAREKARKLRFGF